jgi:hypothetical protein
MPGIQLAEARAKIELADVLDRLGRVPREYSRDQARGPCPIHHSITPSSRCSSVYLKRYVCIWFKCGLSGSQWDRCTLATGRSLFVTSVAVCEPLRREVPWMLHGTPVRPRATDRYAPHPARGGEPGRRAGSIPEHGQKLRAATTQVVPAGPKKWYPF